MSIIVSVETGTHPLTDRRTWNDDWNTSGDHRNTLVEHRNTSVDRRNTSLDASINKYKHFYRYYGGFTLHICFTP